MRTGTCRGPSVDGGATATDSRFTSFTEDWSLAERRSLDQQTVTARESRRSADDDGADVRRNHHSPGSNSWGTTSRSCSWNDNILREDRRWQWKLVQRPTWRWLIVFFSFRLDVDLV